MWGLVSKLFSWAFPASDFSCNFFRILTSGFEQCAHKYFWPNNNQTTLIGNVKTILAFPSQLVDYNSNQNPFEGSEVIKLGGYI